MNKASLIKTAACLTALLASGASGNALAQGRITPAEARSVAREAYIYANPLVDNYRILNGYFLDRNNSEYKGTWNHIWSSARVYTPDDKSVQTPNSDTPYSFLFLDLRTEPIVLTVPPIEKRRYFSVQFIDLYTHNFDYIGSRTTGNGGGHFLIAGPGWKGAVPAGITKAIRSETELAVAAFRTQLFNPGDIDNVKAIQAGYKAQPLSAFLHQPAPKQAPAIDFIAPLSRDEIAKSPAVFQQLNFVLQFCPTVPSEKALMARFARLDIGAGKTFDLDRFSPEVQAAIGQGIADAWSDFAALKKRILSGEVGSGELFGTREHLKNNYLYRMAGAVFGIWGLSADEAIYSTYAFDAERQKLDGANRYILRLAPGQFPPVHAFWSLTMYEMPASLLVANPINRYLINSPMLPELERDSDGGITLYIQHDAPTKAREPNWLPAPKGPFTVVMRLYWPGAAALNGSWKPPVMTRVK